MNPHSSRRRVREPSKPAKAHAPVKFDRLALYAVSSQSEMRLFPLAASELTTELQAATRIANSKLRSLGYTKLGDVDQAAQDAIAQLLLNLRQAADKARHDFPIQTLGSHAILDRLYVHLGTGTGRSISAEATVPAQSNLPGIPLASDAGTVVRRRGSHMTVAALELQCRLLTMTPQAFGRDVGPWSVPAIKQLLDDCLFEISKHAIASLSNVCQDLLRRANAPDGSAQGEALEANELTVLELLSANESHYRAALKSALRVAFGRLDACRATDARSPFVDAFLKGHINVLDAPDVVPYTQARLVLESSGYTAPQIHNGLAVAQNHPIVQEFVNRLKRSVAFHHRRSI